MNPRTSFRRIRRRHTTEQHARHRLAALTLSCLALTGVAANPVVAATTPTVSANAGTETTASTISATAEAAAAFLATLSDEQRTTVLYDFDDEWKTISWSNFPVTFVERAGLNLADLTDAQRTAAMAVLEALLSEQGYATVVGIIGGDQYLDDYSTSTESSLGQYYIAFFGDPSDTASWELQFGGHHLGLNATLDGAAGTITLAPTHLGAQPLTYTDADGNEVSPLLAMYETAFAFYDSLSDEQLAALYQGTEVSNLVCAPGDACDYPTGTGVSGADLGEEQRALLLDVIANWVGLADDETAATTLATIAATLDETYVSWSGATVFDTSTGNGIYFQISGPDVYIELASQQGSAGADVAGLLTSGWGHIHTIYRDPTNDYGGSVTQQQATGIGGGGGGMPGSGGAPGDGGPGR